MNLVHGRHWSSRACRIVNPYLRFAIDKWDGYRRGDTLQPALLEHRRKFMVDLGLSNLDARRAGARDGADLMGLVGGELQHGVVGTSSWSTPIPRPRLIETVIGCVTKK